MAGPSMKFVMKSITNMKNFISFILTTLMLSACSSSMEVFSDYDKGLDITKYHSFKWGVPKDIEASRTNPLYYNELNDKRIREAVNREMAVRNFNAANNTAELDIHYHIVVEDKLASYTETSGSQNHPTAFTPRIVNYQYRQGTLIIDLMDAKTNTLVWRGWATDVVTNAARKNPEAAINKAVGMIFKAFPNGKQ